MLNLIFKSRSSNICFSNLFLEKMFFVDDTGFRIASADVNKTDTIVSLMMSPHNHCNSRTMNIQRRRSEHGKRFVPPALN